MVSAGNPSNQQPFDMNKLFRPSSGPPPTSSSTPVASITSPFPPTMAPPASPTPSFSSTGANSSSSGSFPPSFHLYSPLLAEQQQQQQQMMANAHHHYQHRPISYPSPPPSIPPNLPPSSNTPNSGGARLMALLGSNNTNPNVNLDNPQQVQLSPPFSSSGVSGPTAATPPEFSMPINPPPVIPSVPPANFMATSQPTPVRFPSRKLPKGRHLLVQQITYDIDARLPGEMQPQLEVTPITKYVSDPGLVLGRQIAVNRTYICYGLRQGNIRVLNMNTALRSLLRGHTQRVSDMAFFADDVHLLASASIDGRVLIWKISEDPDEEEKPQIDGKIVVALQITGEGEAVHPRICWHCHKQEILVVAFGNHILKIDSIKLGKVECSAEEPLKFQVDKLINGVQLVGKHESEITELSMCQWMTTRLVSASLDGTVKIWEDHKAIPLAILRPHDDQPVSSVSFLTSPHRPDHIVLITGGPLNREVKLWTSVSEDGWLLPSDSESWRCTQTLEFRSSTEPRIEDAFFNQVMALPQACLLLLANAKKNAIYAVHIDYGPNPAATRMDYIAEFTVTMPILSLTVTSASLPGGEHVVQVYCVQTQAIQQYALDLTQCLPPPLESVVLDATDSSVSRAFDGASSDGSALMEVSHSNKPAEMPLSSAVPVPATTTTAGDSVPVTSHPVSLSSADTGVGVSGNGAENFQTMTPIALGSRASGQLSDFRSPPNSSEPSPHNSATAAAEKLVVDGRVEAINETWVDPPSSHSISQKDEAYVAHYNVSDVSSSPLTFKHATHLITPSEILSKEIPSSENSQSAASMVMGDSKVQYVAVKKDVESIEVNVKVVDEGQGGQGNEFQPTKEPLIIAMEEKEKFFFSQASDIGIQMARDFRREAYDVDVPSQTCKDDVNEELLRHNASEKEIRGPEGDIPAKSGEMAPPTAPQFPASTAKGKRHKGKNSQASAPSLSCPCPFNSTDSLNGPGSSFGTPSMVNALSQVMAMQGMLDQVVNMQKEMQKQMSMMVSAPVTKEGKRLESSFGRSMEKVVKANMDALWAHFQEENAKHEKLERDHMQQLTGLFTNCVNKDLPVLLEKTWKKEIAALGPTVARAIAPVLEKAISTAIADSVQKGIGDKAIGQLERLVNSKLETTLARQIQAQFQTSGKQALQEALQSSFEATVIPSFEGSCRTMFDQVDATFHTGLIKYATVSQQQFESTLSPLAVSLRDAINSASSITQTLNGELADGQRKLLTMVSATANTNPLVTQLSNGPLAGLSEMTEASTDPSKELSRLISDHKYEEAFTTALHRSDVSVVSWLCSQVDLKRILSSVPIPLSQGVLLALFQQLSCDIHRETMKKLAWVTDVAVAINPTDPMIVVHVRPIFEQVYQILGHQRNLPSASAAEASSIHVLMHVINSMLMSCK